MEKADQKSFCCYVVCYEFITTYYLQVQQSYTQIVAVVKIYITRHTPIT